MNNANLTSSIAIALSATALCLTGNAESAQAFNITYDFTVNITSGTYSGNSYKGTFSYDNSSLTGTGLESVSPTQGNLGIRFNFLHTSYTQQQDRDATLDFPRVYFQNGTLLGLSYLVVPPTANPGFFFVPENVPNLVAGFYLGNTDAYNGTLAGSVTYNLQLSPGPSPGPGPCTSSSCPPVPEPSEIAGSLLAIGLLGLGLKLRKKQAS
ncbi:MAG: PEP-CTERM sorting domain-containing protein [Kovacikia sp.]